MSEIKNNLKIFSNELPKKTYINCCSQPQKYHISEIPYQLHRMRHRGELVKTAQLKKGRSDIEDKTTPSII